MSMGETTRRQLPTEKSVAVAAALLLALTGAATAQAAPDTENGRFALAPVPDGLLRLDTRTGASSICADRGKGWACLAMPDERAALDSEIGRLSRDNERLKADLAGLKRDSESLRKDNDTLKAQLAQRDAPATGKTDEALPKGDSMRKPEIKSSDGERKLEIPLPSDRELDRLMAFVESAWRKLVDIAGRIQKDLSGDRI
jgi:regulator of replication initiation timing